jgi:hypothetical protein
LYGELTYYRVYRGVSILGKGKFQCKLPYLTTLSITQTVQRKVIGSLMKSALEMMCKEVILSWLEALFRHLPRRTEENHKQPQSRYFCVMIEFRTGHLPNTFQRCCRPSKLSRS